MIRKVAITGLVAIASLVSPAATKTAAADGESSAYQIKLGTLAPKQSSWGKVFESWKRTVKKDTDGKCEIDWSYGKDEGAMIADMKSGNLHGGALTATGLSKIYGGVVALQMPGLVQTWAQLDAVRNTTKSTFDTAFGAAGYKILGWGDVGIGHVMFRKGEGKPDIKTPDNLKQYHPFYIDGDDMGSMFLSAVGHSSAKKLTVPNILLNIQGRSADSVDVITTPAIAAEQLQWSAHVTHVIDMPVGFGIGGLVMANAAYTAIPEACRQKFADSGKAAGEVLTQTIRGVDDEAWKGLKNTKTVITLSAEEKAAWQAKFAEVRNRMKSENKIDGATWTAVTNAAAAAK
jgi:TRAP-type C4-dicarboxylate transport system substrate-binding protein